MKRTTSFNTLASSPVLTKCDIFTFEVENQSWWLHLGLGWSQSRRSRLVNLVKYFIFPLVSSKRKTIDILRNISLFLHYSCTLSRYHWSRVLLIVSRYTHTVNNYTHLCRQYLLNESPCLKSWKLLFLIKTGWHLTLQIYTLCFKYLIRTIPFPSRWNWALVGHISTEYAIWRKFV